MASPTQLLAVELLMSLQSCTFGWLVVIAWWLLVDHWHLPIELVTGRSQLVVANRPTIINI
jgi:hypothetical protein